MNCSPFRVPHTSVEVFRFSSIVRSPQLGLGKALKACGTCLAHCVHFVHHKLKLPGQSYPKYISNEKKKSLK